MAAVQTLHLIAVLVVAAEPNWVTRPLPEPRLRLWIDPMAVLSIEESVAILLSDEVIKTAAENLKMQPDHVRQCMIFSRYARPNSLFLNFEVTVRMSGNDEALLKELTKAYFWEAKRRAQQEIVDRKNRRRAAIVDRIAELRDQIEHLNEDESSDLGRINRASQQIAELNKELGMMQRIVCGTLHVSWWMP